MKKQLIKQITEKLPMHPNPAAALFMLYWTLRSGDQQRVTISKKMFEDLRIFISGVFSTTVKTALMIALPAYHEECMNEIEVDMSFSYDDLPEIVQTIEHYIEVIAKISRDGQDRVHLGSISVAIGKASVSQQELSVV